MPCLNAVMFLDKVNTIFTVSTRTWTIAIFTCIKHKQMKIQNAISQDQDGRIFPNGLKTFSHRLKTSFAPIKKLNYKVTYWRQNPKRGNIQTRKREDGNSHGTLNRWGDFSESCCRTNTYWYTPKEKFKIYVAKEVRGTGPILAFLLPLS